MMFFIRDLEFGIIGEDDPDQLLFLLAYLCNLPPLLKSVLVTGNEIQLSSINQVDSRFRNNYSI